MQIGYGFFILEYEIEWCWQEALIEKLKVKNRNEKEKERERRKRFIKNFHFIGSLLNLSGF